MNNANPIVSVIIPNYNHALFLRERLYSIINQTFQDLELIILDDASTDQSLEILAEYKNHPKVKHFIENPVNSGSPFIQWKKGIELAQGEYIWIAESDDYADLRFLEEAVPIFMEHAETGIVCVHSTLVNDQGKIIGNTAERLKLKNSIVEKTEDILVIIDGKTFLEGYFLGESTIYNASGVLFRKSLLASDVFSDKKQLGDTFLWASILLRGSSIAFLKKRLNFFRIHKDSTTQKNMHSNRIKVLTEQYELLYYIQKNSVESHSKKTLDIGNKRLAKKWVNTVWQSENILASLWNAKLIRIAYHTDKYVMVKFIKYILKKAANKIVGH